jgi:hypothetical protein
VPSLPQPPPLEALPPRHHDLQHAVNLDDADAAWAAWLALEGETLDASLLRCFWWQIASYSPYLPPAADFDEHSALRQDALRQAGEAVRAARTLRQRLTDIWTALQDGEREALGPLASQRYVYAHLLPSLLLEEMQSVAPLDTLYDVQEAQLCAALTWLPEHSASLVRRAARLLASSGHLALAVEALQDAPAALDAPLGAHIVSLAASDESARQGATGLLQVLSQPGAHPARHVLTLNTLVSLLDERDVEALLAEMQSDSWLAPYAALHLLKRSHTVRAEVLQYAQSKPSPATEGRDEAARGRRSARSEALELPDEPEMLKSFRDIDARSALMHQVAAQLAQEALETLRAPRSGKSRAGQDAETARRTTPRALRRAMQLWLSAPEAVPTPLQADEMLVSCVFEHLDSASRAGPGVLRAADSAMLPLLRSLTAVLYQREARSTHARRRTFDLRKRSTLSAEERAQQLKLKPASHAALLEAHLMLGDEAGALALWRDLVAREVFPGQERDGAGQIRHRTRGDVLLRREYYDVILDSCVVSAASSSGSYVSGAAIDRTPNVSPTEAMLLMSLRMAHSPLDPPPDHVILKVVRGLLQHDGLAAMHLLQQLADAQVPLTARLATAIVRAFHDAGAEWADQTLSLAEAFVSQWCRRANKDNAGRVTLRNALTEGPRGSILEQVREWLAIGKTRQRDAPPLLLFALAVSAAGRSFVDYTPERRVRTFDLFNAMRLLLQAQLLSPTALQRTQIGRDGYRSWFGDFAASQVRSGAIQYQTLLAAYNGALRTVQAAPAYETGHSELQLEPLRLEPTQLLPDALHASPRKTQSAAPDEDDSLFSTVRRELEDVLGVPGNAQTWALRITGYLMPYQPPPAPGDPHPPSWASLEMSRAEVFDAPLRPERLSAALQLFRLAGEAKYHRGGDYVPPSQRERIEPPRQQVRIKSQDAGRLVVCLARASRFEEAQEVLDEFWARHLGSSHGTPGGWTAGIIGAELALHAMQGRAETLELKLAEAQRLGYRLTPHWKRNLRLWLRQKGGSVAALAPAQQVSPADPPREAAELPLPEREDEWRRRVFSALASGQPAWSRGGELV